MLAQVALAEWPGRIQSDQSQMLQVLFLSWTMNSVVCLMVVKLVVEWPLNCHHHWFLHLVRDNNAHPSPIQSFSLIESSIFVFLASLT
ncbi:hypothetical protein SLA2020_039900 [Shorea laevis]